MDLFICGRNPLLEHRQPSACPRWHRSFSNKCTHVPSGQVEVGTDHQICPLSVLTPIHVVSSQRLTKVVKTEAQNILVVDDEKIQWSSDGLHDVRRDFGSKHMTRSQLQSIQDMWPEPDTLKEMESMFDYESNFPPLGLLTRDGAIYSINQEFEPGTLVERTSSRTRRPFRHALIRQEVNNMKCDTWPYVVFEEQPYIIFRFLTIKDLLHWLDGVVVQFSIIAFSSKILQLLTCAGVKGEDCMALTEDGKVYHWARGAAIAFQTGTLSETLHSLSSSKECSVSIDGQESHGAQIPQTMSISAIIRLAAGPTYGAVITATGDLYVFCTTRLACDNNGQCTEFTLDEFYVSSIEKSRVYDPYTPRLAKICDRVPQPFIVDVAIGHNHVVALTSTGEVFTAGDGMHGQLGVGERQFDLHVEKHPMSDSGESWEFAEHWQKVEIGEEERTRGCAARGKVVAVHAGCDSTLFIVS